jgi:hypothetical protein
MTIERLESEKNIPPRLESDARFVILHSFPPPDLETAWRGLLSRLAVPAHYDCPEFFQEHHWAGERHFAVLAVDQGSVVGVLTGQHRGNETLSGLQSRPQVCIDPAADSNAVLSSLARGLLSEAGPDQLVTAYTWGSMPLDAFQTHGFRRREFEGDIVLDLKNGAESLFKEFHASRRKNIRQAIKNGVEVSQAKTANDVESFYQLHVKWRQTGRKKILTPLIPREVFEERFRHPENFRFFLARHSGSLVAAITLRFCPGGLIEFSDHNSLDEFLYLKPNDLLQWRAIEWACSEGFPRCSLGGAHTFHRRFGGTLIPIIRYRIDRSLLRRHDRREAAMDSARAQFRQLPRPVQKVVRRILGSKQEPS